MYLQTHLLFDVDFPLKLAIDQFILLRNCILTSTDSQESQFYVLLPQFRPMGHSIKIHTIKSGWSIV